jgi:hypothetical protein
MRDPGYGMRDPGYGMRDTRYGMRDTRYGMRDTRYGMRDPGTATPSCHPDRLRLSFSDGARTRELRGLLLSILSVNNSSEPLRCLVPRHDKSVWFASRIPHPVSRIPHHESRIPHLRISKYAHTRKHIIKTLQHIRH